jgi:hypothetical protein
LALAILAGLEHLTDVISIEKIDDVAVQNETDLVTMTVQSKHSISPNGTTFEDTSKALWRTFEIWLEKIKSNELGDSCKFICATNKSIPNDALIRKIKSSPLNDLDHILKALVKEQKQKLKEAKTKDKEKGATISQTIKRIENALSNWHFFSIIKQNIEIWDQNSPKEVFLNQIHMAGQEYSEVAKDNVYHNMLGWINSASKAKWMQGAHANFTKSDFDAKYLLVRNNHSLVRAVFRKKIHLGTFTTSDIDNKRNDLFVRQIEDIKRNNNAKARKIEDAIINFLYHDIEVTHILQRGNITKADFDDFREKCQRKWETCFDNHVRKEIEEYSEDEKNELAISIYDEIMDKIEVKFFDNMEFNPDNRYIHNGTFLQLSNIPEIGWHPEWQSKYKKDS